MSVKTVNLSFPAKLLQEIDRAAKHFYASRSEYIRHAVIEQLQTDSIPDHSRRRTRKNVPGWAIKSSHTDEYDLADNYE